MLETLGQEALFHTNDISTTSVWSFYCMLGPGLWTEDTVVKNDSVSSGISATRSSPPQNIRRASEVFQRLWGLHSSW